ncbi:hypothetical protein HZB94_00060 [Candidatus Falkowbacteria bacterium]|nr:hypothetical protein [Candidatus Falkowbacteria bacterium]
MTISLLPDELRRKEEEEKQKTKEAQGLPKFKLHLPDEKKIPRQARDDNGEARKDEKIAPAMEFGAGETPSLRKGVFRVVKRDDLPLSPSLAKKDNLPLTPSLVKKDNLPFVPSLVRRGELSQAPKQEVKPKTPEITRPNLKPTEDGAYKMRIPEIKENLNEHGKQIIRETTDKIAEIKESTPLFDFLKTKIETLKFRRPPAEVNLISDDYAAVARLEFWRRIKVLMAIILIFCLICAACFFAIKIKRASLAKQFVDLSYAIDQTTAEINSFSMERAQAEKMKDRASVLKILLKNHLYWTKIFDFLEHNISANVYFTNFVAESKGNILLTGEVKSYSDIAKQLYIFENSELLKSAVVNSAGKKTNVGAGPSAGGLKDILAGKLKENTLAPSASGEGIEFNVVLTFKDEALIK